MHRVFGRIVENQRQQWQFNGWGEATDGVARGINADGK